MTNFPVRLQQALKPLEELGMGREQARLVAAGFEGLVRRVFEARIGREFSDKQRSQFNELKGSLDPAGAISKLEEEYQKKTGKSFLDLYAEVFAEVVGMAARAGKTALENYQKLAQLGPEETSKFVQAMERKDEVVVREILGKIG